MLIGNVGKDPEIKVLQNGHTIARFDLATSETIRKSDGTKHTDTYWHQIIAWNSLAQVIEKYVYKGSHLHLIGKIQYRTYTTGSEENLETHTVTEIVADEIIMLDKKENKNE
jgi:single-strand DNA-binding protein